MGVTLALLAVGMVLSFVGGGAVAFVALFLSSGTADTDFVAIPAALVGLAPPAWYLLRLRARGSNGR